VGHARLRRHGPAAEAFEAFGQSARLVPTQVWDRFRERPLWSSQQAVRNARDHADIILYLVNASEDPQDAGYVALEMEILAWIDKPIVLLLNQMGPPREDAAGEEERWQAHLRAYPLVQGALTLDAFARCWVQEGNLLRTVADLLPPERKPAMARLQAAWQERNLARFHTSMRLLAEPLAAAAVDREPVGERRWLDTIGDAFAKDQPPEARRAMQKLAERLEAGVRSSTEGLIAEHGLSGKAAREVLDRMQKSYASSAPAKEGWAAVMGGLMSGAVGGLAADLAAGGLTFGGGMIVGGVLGALGAGGVARGYNLVRGEAEPAVRWSEELFQTLFCSSLLRYLAVAHFGRGRGDYEESEHPAFWQSATADVTGAHREEIRRIWRSGKEGGPEALVAPLQALLARCAARLLSDFYPEARDLFADELRAPLPAPAKAEPWEAGLRTLR
jgi:PAS domain-containing protein